MFVFSFIKTTQANNKNIAATWSESGKVYIWDLTTPLEAVSDENKMKDYVKNNTPLPIYQFNGHQNEGFGMDWSNVEPGVLATGDRVKNIHIWKPRDNFTAWNVDQRPFVSHTASVEDVQWSPNEASVFASCSVDKSIKIWDCRVTPSKACMLTCNDAHDSDVNVISWNKNEPFIASGGDDAFIKIWDLRVFSVIKVSFFTI